MFKFSFILLLISFSSVSQARQSCDWPFRTSISINEESNNNLTDYTISLTLTGGATGTLHSGYEWSSGGQDLRVYNSDDNAELEFHIDSWDQGHEVANIRVLLPTLNKLQTKTIYLYYGNTTASSQSSGNIPDITYVNGKIKFHTRANSTDTTSLNHAKSLFDGVDDSDDKYGCSHPSIFEEITNVNQGPATNNNRSSKNFIAYSQTLFTAQSQGDWGFRYGADYGRGGGLYVNGVALDERWDDNLWWERNWSHTDVLSGSITLPAGEHKLEIIGAEDGNDGGLTIQFKEPGGAWALFNDTNITMRSQSCPTVFHTVQYGSHDVCSVDLQFDGDKVTAPNNWNINRTQELSLKIKNDRNAVNTATLPITVEIQLPTGMSRTAMTGSDWSCSGTSGLITCVYSQSLTSNGKSSQLVLSVFTDRSTASPANITASVSSSQYDIDSSNNSVSSSKNVRDRNTPAPAVTPSCGINPPNGIWARFFDTQGYGDTVIDNAEDYQALVNARVDRVFLDGQTILENINGVGNNFNDSTDDDYFLTMFQGYLKIPDDDDYEFSVDGDDAIEFWIDGLFVTEFYGAHGQNGSPINPVVVKLAAGFHSIEYRFQEIAGDDIYRLYMRKKSDSNTAEIITKDLYYHCAGPANIQLSTDVVVISDDINGTSNPKAIPNAIMNISITATNQGNISTDLNSTEIKQAIDAGTELYVNDFNGPGPINFVDGTNASNLSYQYVALNDGTDSISFSSDGSNFNHTATPDADGYDSAITHIRINFGGSFKAQMDGIQPAFGFEYQTRIK